MKNITRIFSDHYLPVKGLVFYRQPAGKNDSYVEAYDFGENGRMINAHPLSVEECQELAQSLKVSEALSDHFLQPEGLLPPTLLYLRSGANGFAIWYTPAVTREMYFVDDLGIQNGAYPIPPMIWKAGRERLSVFAYTGNKKPTAKSKLCHAPFFNVYSDGKVCMGDVDVQIENHIRLEQFMENWQNYFFNSKFSHVIGNTSPLEGNIIQFWNSLKDLKKFPLEHLKKHSETLKNLIA